MAGHPKGAVGGMRQLVERLQRSRLLPIIRRVFAKIFVLQVRHDTLCTHQICIKTTRNCTCRTGVNIYTYVHPAHSAFGGVRMTDVPTTAALQRENDVRLGHRGIDDVYFRVLY